MTSRSMRRFGLAAIVVMGLMTIGCTSTTMVTFRGPPGAVMFVDNKPYHLPAQVALDRPSSDSGSKRHDVSLAFTTSTQPREIRAAGYIDVFGYTASDIDKVAVNTCDLDEAQLVKIPEGTTVIFKGQSASRQPLYEMVLKKP